MPEEVGKSMMLIVLLTNDSMRIILVVTQYGPPGLDIACDKLVKKSIKDKFDHIYLIFMVKNKAVEV